MPFPTMDETPEEGEQGHLTKFGHLARLYNILKESTLTADAVRDELMAAIANVAADLSSVAIGATFVVESEAEMLALGAQKGDVAIRTDVDGIFLLLADTADELISWKQIVAVGSVLSVDGQVGAVSLEGTYLPMPTGTPVAGQTPVVTAASPLTLDWEAPPEGGGGGGSGVPSITVPYFGRDEPGPVSVYHGAFWPIGVDLGPFYWEAWVRPNTGGEYWISEGFGGAHAILAGFGGGGVPTGNVYDGLGNTSFSGLYTAQNGEWLHYGVLWDGAIIWVLINGMVVGKFPWVGPRRAQFGDLFIGGSDHSNFKGCIAQVRAWEGQVPNAAPWYGFAFAVERYFSDRQSTPGAVCQFLANYLMPVDTYPDMSDGFYGQHHPGSSRGIYNGFAWDAGPEIHPPRIVDPTAPFGAQKDVARTRVPAAPVAAPVGAKIWDSFGRADSIYAFTLAPSMGSTEGGSLGAKVWSHTPTHWGIFDSTAFCATQTTFARVANNSPDMDVRVGRVYDAAKGLVYGSCAARIKADLSTGWRLTTYIDYLGDTQVLLTRPDYSTAGSWVASGGWTHLRLVTSGTTLTAYVDNGVGGWTQLGQVTGETQNQTEVGAGMYHANDVGTAGRYTDFEVR